MKKYLMLASCLTFLTFAVNAFALVSNYDASGSFPDKLNNGHPGTSFTFETISDNFIYSATTPYPYLTLSLEGSGFSDTLKIGSNTLATFTAENPTYVFDATTLVYLNNAITSGSVEFSLVSGNNKPSTLNSAKLTGTVAPEPASMALVCAGLGGLPFARRLRKAISTRS